MPHTTLLRELEGFSLTTAEILYRLPDYPRLLQSYIWQDYDVAPEFPKLAISLIIGRPISMDRSTECVSPTGVLIAPQEFRFVSGELRLN